MKHSIWRYVITAVIVLAAYMILLNVLVHHEAAEPHAVIRTFGDALWYSVVTLTTVGYGDIYPVSDVGKAVGYIFVIGSLGVLGYLIGKLAYVVSEIKTNRKMGYYGTNFTNHVVIIGWNQFAETIVEQLITSDQKAAIITNKEQEVEAIHKQYSPHDVFVLYSQYHNYSLLRKANIEKSANVFLNFEKDIEKLVHLINYKKTFHAKCRYIVILSNGELRQNLINIGADLVMVKNDMASSLIASHIFEPFVADYTEDLLSSASSDDQYDVQQYRITDSNPFVGKLYQEVFRTMKAMYNTILIGLARGEGQNRIVHKNPADPAMTIEVGDYLIVITSGKSKASLVKDFGVNEGGI